MSTTSARHAFLNWITGTTAADTVFNDLVDNLDVKLGLSVESRTTTAEPGSPSNGDCYIIPASATGTDWATYSENDIAAYRDSAWTNFTPVAGQIVHIADESDLVAVWSGSSWVTVSTSAALNKYDATAAPTANDDTGDGYSAGSLWVDVTNDEAYVCLDATSTAAVWTQITNETVPLDKYDATAAPGVGDDTGDGYSVGSIWCDVTNDKAYICLDASSGAAVWTEITQTGGSSTFEFSSDVETAADQDYVLWWDAPFAGSITKVRTKTQSGTCTVTGKVNTTALGGTANSASSTAEEQTHSSSNTFSKGDKLLFTVSSNSSATDLAVTFYGTRS